MPTALLVVFTAAGYYGAATYTAPYYRQFLLLRSLYCIAVECHDAIHASARCCVAIKATVLPRYGYVTFLTFHLPVDAWTTHFAYNDALLPLLSLFLHCSLPALLFCVIPLHSTRRARHSA